MYASFKKVKKEVNHRYHNVLIRHNHLHNISVFSHVPIHAKGLTKMHTEGGMQEGK